ncbi:hypothetical protein Cwoe_3369 [Conexibacter woesei DSM 14684]|uniref:Uncharacterized protein n=1 Tax=Conexibacter woesei (strain DSM 14684 / CCUG 47730 / CIP 108061 / JCM 11494 / NBRC 100937 / ID131577) TaxID=469383 RepID=D3FF70_CONWI|nr:hypothetical protein Cwoe_3369 [Conexibacter woesei DSM 14684]
MKFEVKGLHDRGLEVFTAIYEVAIHKGKAKIIEAGKRRPKGALHTVIGVGRIPFEWISHMDWDHNNADQLPVLHVAYGRRGPFREWVPCSLAENDTLELLDVRFKVRKKGWLHQFRSNRQLREMDRAGKTELHRMLYGDDAVD